MILLRLISVYSVCSFLSVQIPSPCDRFLYSRVVIFTDKLCIPDQTSAPWENVTSGICGQRRPRSACTSAQSDQGLPCPQTELLYSTECLNGKQMPGCTFSLDAAHIYAQRRHKADPHLRCMVRESHHENMPI